LKTFDEEFQLRRGRAPRKVDKEVIRPLYQKYHETKADLDSVRLVIEAAHGYIPEELLKDDKEVATQSEGEGRDRTLTIFPKN
jgi:hypothetical protein